MDLNTIPLFGAVKKRLNWLGQRQEILAQNIANADTPEYRAKDIQAFRFRDLLRSQNSVLRMASTQANHLTSPKRATDFKEFEVKKPYETAPNGNSVVLEEQMAMMSETSVGHKLTTNLYKKHLNMLRMALGDRR